MDADRFFNEVTRELAEIEDANSYLQRITEEMKQQRIDDEYHDFIQSMLKEVYDEVYDDSFTWS